MRQDAMAHYDVTNKKTALGGCSTTGMPLKYVLYDKPKLYSIQQLELWARGFCLFATRSNSAHIYSMHERKYPAPFVDSDYPQRHDVRACSAS